MLLKNKKGFTPLEIKKIMPDDKTVGVKNKIYIGNNINLRSPKGDLSLTGFTPLERPSPLRHSFSEASNKMAIRNKMFKNYDLMLPSNHNIRRTSLAGFTLIEVMITLLITSIVVMIVYSTYRSAVNAYEHEKLRGYLYQDVKIIFEYLQKDIHCAFVNSQNRNLVFIGRDIENETMESDSLEITTTSSFELDKNRDKFPLKRVKYFLNSDEENVNSGLQRVMLSEDLEQKYSDSTLGPLVRELKFRYYDGARWQDSWGINKRTGEPFERGFVLPKAVEVTLTFEDKDNPTRFAIASARREGRLVISKIIPVMAGATTFYK